MRGAAFSLRSPPLSGLVPGFSHFLLQNLSFPSPSPPPQTIYLGFNSKTAVILNFCFYSASKTSSCNAFSLTSPQANLSAWHHIVATVQWPGAIANNLSLYNYALSVDGTAAATATTGTFTPPADVARTTGYLGRSSTSTTDAYFKGGIAEVAIYGYSPAA